MFRDFFQGYVLSGLAAAAMTLLAGCGRGYSSSVPSNNPPQEEKRGGKEVKTTRVTLSALERTVEVTGSLAAYDQAILSTKVAGRVEKIPVDLGTSVRHGELIAQIEPRDYKLRVQQSAALLAQARVRLGLPLEGTEDQVDIEKTGTVRQTRAVLEEARANRDRIRKLSQEGILSKSELDSAEAAHEVALSRHEEALEEVRTRLALVGQRRAEWEIAQQQLTDTAIQAPFDGVVQERRANAGEYLIASAPVAMIVRIDPLRLRVEVPEREAVHVRIGQKVRLTVEGITNVYTGEIKRLSPVIDEQARVLRVEADVPNPGSLRPGSFVRAAIVVNEADPGMVIPAKSLLTFAGIEKVFVVREGKIFERVIATKRRPSTQDTLEVTAGLSPGDLVVVEPNGVQIGQAVTAVE